MQSQNISVYHNIFVNKAFSSPGRSEVWVFLCTGSFYPPNFAPSLVQRLVNRENSRVVGCNCVTRVDWDSMFLQVKKMRDLLMVRKIFCVYIWVFGSFGFSTKEPLYNHALSVVVVGVILCWCQHCRLCTPPPGTWLDIETSYLVHMCTYVPPPPIYAHQIFNDSDL